ncbi:MAG: potassium channel family protein [Micrococcales bacterium]
MAKINALAALGRKLSKPVDNAMIVLSVIFLVVYSVQVISRDLTTGVGPNEAELDILQWVIYGLFALGLAWNLIVEIALPKSERNWKNWWAENILGIIALVPATAAARSLRLLRLVMVFRGLTQIVQGAASRLGLLVFSALPIVAYITALAVLDVETAGGVLLKADGSGDMFGGQIHNIGEALWWAIVTMSTVGYGDFFPHTFEGRIIGVFTLASGIVLIATITAMVATKILDQAAAGQAA